MRVATLNWRLERDELVHCVDLVEPEGIVDSADFSDRSEWIHEDCVSEPEVLTYDGETGDPFADLVSTGAAAGDPPYVNVDPEQGWDVMYTSGTTSLPEGVVLSHRAEFARAVQVRWTTGSNEGTATRLGH